MTDIGSLALWRDISLYFTLDISIADCVSCTILPQTSGTNTLHCYLFREQPFNIGRGVNYPPRKQTLTPPPAHTHVGGNQSCFFLLYLQWATTEPRKHKQFVGKFRNTLFSNIPPPNKSKQLLPWILDLVLHYCVKTKTDFCSINKCMHIDRPIVVWFERRPCSQYTQDSYPSHQYQGIYYWRLLNTTTILGPRWGCQEVEFKKRLTES